MVGLSALVLPILVSAVFVFILSSIIHMFTPWHKSDYRKLDNEQKVMDALRPLNIPGGEYMMPMASGMAEMRSPEFKEKREKGPVAMLTIWPSGQPSMTKPLVYWFVYLLVVGVFAGYVAGRAVPAGAAYLQVFRFAGTTAFVGYTLALWQMAIWFNRPLLTTIKSTIDGLIYALVTAGVFGWLWPR